MRYGMLLLVVLIGCASPHAQTLCTVKGKVTYNGSPVDRTTIVFTPIEKGRQDVCTVEKGQYQTTLIGGKYKISFDPAHGGTRLPNQYKRETVSKIEIEVSKDNDNLDFILK